MKRKSGDQVRLREHLQQKLRTTHFFDCFKSFYNLINFLCPLRKLLSRVTCWNELISEVSWVINLSVPMVGFNWEAFSRWKNMKCHLFPVPSCLEWLLQTLDRTPKVVSPSCWAMDLEGEYSRLDHVTNRNNIYFLFSDKIKKWVIFWYTLISIVSGTVPSGDLFTRRQLQKRNMFKGRLLVECFIPSFETTNDVTLLDIWISCQEHFTSVATRVWQGWKFNWKTKWIIWRHNDRDTL